MLERSQTAVYFCAAESKAFAVKNKRRSFLERVEGDVSKQRQFANYSNANFDLLRATVADALTAIAIIPAMSFGVVTVSLIRSISP